VDGVLTNRSDQGVLWIKPGDYTFNIKLGAVNWLMCLVFRAAPVTDKRRMN